MQLSELITALIDIDLSDPTAGSTDVFVEWEPDTGHFWIIVGSHRIASSN